MARGLGTVANALRKHEEDAPETVGDIIVTILGGLFMLLAAGVFVVIVGIFGAAGVVSNDGC